MKQPWEAETFEELEELLTPTLNGKETALQYICRLLSMRHRQRAGDIRRNKERRAILNYVNNHPKLKKDVLKSA